MKILKHKKLDEVKQNDEVYCSVDGAIKLVEIVFDGNDKPLYALLDGSINYSQLMVYDEINTGIAIGNEVVIESEIRFIDLAKDIKDGTYLVKTYVKYNDHVEYGILRVYNSDRSRPMGSYSGMFLFDLNDDYVPLSYMELK